MTCLQPLYGISVVYKSHLITHHSVVRVCLPASFIVCLCVCLHVCVFVCLCICLHVCVFCGRWSCLSDLLFFILDIICTMIQFMYNSLFFWMSTSCLEQMTGWPVTHKACVTQSSRMDTERLVLLQVHVVSSTLTSQLLTSKVYIWHKRVHEHMTRTHDTNT